MPSSGTSSTRSSRNPTGSSLVIPTARADSNPLRIGGVALLAGDHQAQQGAAVASDDQHGPVLAPAGIVLVNHPRPDDLAGIGPAVQARRVHEFAGPLRGGPAVAGHRPARDRRVGRWRRRGGDDVRGDPHGLLQLAQDGLGILDVPGQPRGPVEHQILGKPLERLPLRFPGRRHIRSIDASNRARLCPSRSGRRCIDTLDMPANRQ